MFDRDFLSAALSDTPLSLLLFSSIDSTNTEARRYALGGGSAPALFLAEEQTAGRGRMGRSFFSPKDTGIYLSLLCKSDDLSSDPITVTSAAAVAVYRAIRSVTGISVGIKWVNDLYYEGKKICGILAESFFVGEERFFIVGVGLNLSTVDFPSDLRDKAGSLFSENTELSDTLCAALAHELYALVTEGCPEEFMKDYRAASLVLGAPVTYRKNDVERQAVAESVDDLGRLLVRHSDGTTDLLASGEISLRIHDKGEII